MNTPNVHVYFFASHFSGIVADRSIFFHPIAAQGGGKPWYKKFTNSDNEVQSSDVPDVSDLVKGNVLDKQIIGERIISDL